MAEEKTADQSEIDSYAAIRKVCAEDSAVNK
jgi:hypothetical protein